MGEALRLFPPFGGFLLGGEGGGGRSGPQARRRSRRDGRSPAVPPKAERLRPEAGGRQRAAGDKAGVPAA